MQPSHPNAAQDSLFEAAVEAVITGDLPALQSYLTQDPALVHHHSTRPHHATLLHYIAANGVEDERQVTPPNAVDVARLLLEAGAKPDAPCDAYDTKWATTLDLLVSSVHPHNAGVQSALAELLLDFGAAINGIHDNGSPIHTALSFHYPQAAETLARRGARLDTIVAAAGLDRVDLIDRYLDDKGQLRPDVPLVNLPWLPYCKDNPTANVHQALVWAATHRRNAAVSRMLERGVDPAATDHRNFTALHWAAYYRYLDTVQLLLPYNPPLEAQNEFGGTVLDQTIWCVMNEGFHPDDHLPLIKMLLSAGAKVPTWWLRVDRDPPLPPQVAEALRRRR
jgi:ankyrin repeat protein